MDRRTFATLSTAIVAQALGPAPLLAATDPPLKLRWADLVPPAPTPSRPIVVEGEVDISQFVPPEDYSIPTPPMHESEEPRWMSRSARTRRPPAAVVPSLDGKRVEIGGYVVPLDLDARAVTELLLVPFVGACIHVPPPPSNQLIHVTSPQPLAIKGLFDPVWVTGRLGVQLTSTGLADAGYVLRAERIAHK